MKEMNYVMLNSLVCQKFVYNMFGLRVVQFSIIIIALLTGYMCSMYLLLSPVSMLFTQVHIMG